MTFRRDPKFKLLLVRHGQTDANKEMRFVGSTDVPLNKTGREQARLMAARLAERPIEHIYSSPALRAHETAKLINNSLQAEISLDERLWELDHKNWEGKTIQEIYDQDPQAWEDWMNLKIEAPHGGETLEDVAIRARSWLTDLDKAYEGKNHTLLVAAHGGLLQVMLCELLGTTRRNFWPYRFQNTGLAEVWVYNLGATLISFG
ncbi:MAG: histidine phosphatase family protein [Chloroflexota bacterium]